MGAPMRLPPKRQKGVVHCPVAVLQHLKQPRLAALSATSHLWPLLRLEAGHKQRVGPFQKDQFFAPRLTGQARPLLGRPPEQK